MNFHHSDFQQRLIPCTSHDLYYSKRYDEFNNKLPNFSFQLRYDKTIMFSSILVKPIPNFAELGPAQYQLVFKPFLFFSWTIKNWVFQKRNGFMEKIVNVDFVYPAIFTEI